MKNSILEEIPKTILLADVGVLDQESEKTKVFIKEQVDLVLDYTDAALAEIEDKTRVFLYLKDQQVKQVLPLLSEKECAVGFLPHPDAAETRSGYQVPKDTQTALEDLLNSKRRVDTGLLACNDEIVLNHVVIGEIVTFLTKKSNKKNFFHKLYRFFRYLKRLVNIKAFPLTIKAEDKNAIDTAATDVLIVQYAHNSVVSRVFTSTKLSSERLFHTFIFAPRSVLQLIRAYLVKLLLGSGQTNKKFDFLSHLKTENVSITSTQSFKCDIDGRWVETKELNFKFVGNLKQIPSESITYEAESKDASSSKAFHTKNLPRGESRKEMVRKNLPFITHASSDEYKGLFKQLRENARPSQNYVVLMMLSVILATLGVFANSSPVIIGAMILAPLMSPIISLSMGVLRQDQRLIKNSFITILVGVGVGYLFAIIFTIITPITQINPEITSRIKPNIIDLGIAVVSGAAGAYAFSKEEIAKTLAGVAIAVALVPPLAVSGIGLAWLNFEVFFGAFLLLITNLTGMILAASFTFLMTGYSPFRLAKKGLLISLIVVFSISIPLGYGFFKVVQENNIIRSLNTTEINNMKLENVVLEETKPMVISLDVLVDNEIENTDIDLVKDKIEEIVGQEVIIKAAVRIKR
ncbi:TIGR00341 family protein [Brumimicrobium salinarum]|uniref:TIGR00341 family protein n=1 Tax=Brumimicrobium salinarum TaxID=2058658 RepID=A0A2I0R0S4_9FLAO|nr:TIGR00341 family protein [Brumimicrobium salinarum]PKR80186.1 TIGR00341 family protein [Brumimicrobium salinarum]